MVASLALDFAAALGGCLDHADHGEMQKLRFVGLAAAGEQPIDVVADEMTAATATTAVR